MPCFYRGGAACVRFARVPCGDVPRDEYKRDIRVSASEELKIEAPQLQRQGCQKVDTPQCVILWGSPWRLYSRLSFISVGSARLEPELPPPKQGCGTPVMCLLLESKPARNKST